MSSGSQPTGGVGGAAPGAGKKVLLLGLLGGVFGGALAAIVLAMRQPPPQPEAPAVAPAVVDAGAPAAAPQPIEQPVAPAQPKVGFKMGELKADEPIETVKVTLAVGPEGDELREPVDLHLGIGFPLRLYPLGTDSREPAFAAFPQKSSLERGVNSVKPGQTATFEFAAKPQEDLGADELRTTPELLSDLKVGDLQRIAFASRGTNNWVLDGYTIEINGKLFASNDSVAAKAKDKQSTNQTELQSLLPAHEAAARQVSDLEAYVATGLATDADKTDLEKQRGELAKLSAPVETLAATVAGAQPWFVEQNEAFKPTPLSGKPVNEVEVTLVPGSDDRPGSKNPVYLWAGGRKHLLASETDPLSDEPAPQVFVLRAADLKSDPLVREKLDTVGIGMIGNDMRFARIPDRAKLQRVVVKVDGETVYDSETKPGDRKALDALWLIPPAHRDEAGNVVIDTSTPRELNLWKAGMQLEGDALADAGPAAGQPVEPPAEPAPPLQPGQQPLGAPLDKPGDGTLGKPLDGAQPADTAKPGDTPKTDTPAAGTPQTNPAPSDPLAPSPLGPSPLGGAPLGGAPLGGAPIGGVPVGGGLVAGGFDPLGGFGAPQGGFVPGLGGLNSPRRRRPPPVVVVIPAAAPGAPAAGNVPPAGNNPAGGRRPNPGGQAAGPQNPNPNPPVVPKPAPAAPVLASIRINPAVPPIRVGDQATVNWQISGDTSKVASYRVDIFGVLPHKNPPLINTPMATQTNIPPLRVAAAGGIQNMLARPPAINLAAIQAQLTGAEASYLYVQPKVTALAADGTALVSSFGSILPLFPAGMNLTPGRGVQALFFGQAAGAVVPPPSFQVIPAAGAPLPWTTMPSTDPQTTTTAWPLTTEQDSHFALTFANYATQPGALFNVLPTYSMAARPAAGGERITLQLEGNFALPANLTPAANAYRLLGHVAFIGGATAASNALVQTRINLSTFGGGGVATPHFTMETRAPMNFAKFSAGTTPAPCLLIDMPLRFDLMTANNTAASPHDATKYFITTFTPVGHAVATRLGAAYMTVTVMVAMNTTDTADAVGVFGLRLIPEN